MVTMDDINVRALQDRATKIIKDPKSEWNVIEAEPTTADTLYKSYVMPLAAIPAIASFIGNVVVGTPMPFIGWYRAGVVAGLVGAVLAFVMVLIGVYVAALVVSKLAPSFESVADDRQALKLVAYAFTPAWIAGALNVIPMLWPLTLLANVYAIYLFFLGLPVMMKTPDAKVIPYMAVSAVVIIVTMLVLALIAGSITAAMFVPSIV